jgi:transglutaminase-like putative cysteine protease
MPELQTLLPLESYLQPTTYIDFEHHLLQEFLARYRSCGQPDVEIARRIFEFVRDEIAHSGDIQSRRVTRKASEVLEHREGICYAKAHLLAALLRGLGIPSGLCYQRLTCGGTVESGHVVHGLNSVYLASLGKWIRLDARGNKSGMDAQFSLDGERLAFRIREEQGERDYPMNLAEPHPTIVRTLEAYDDRRRLYGTGGLPAEIRPAVNDRPVFWKAV